MNGDVHILRELAKHYAEVAARPVQDERRRLWRDKNSLRPTRPLIYVRAWAWHEMPQSELHCEDPLYRGHEDFLRRMLFWDTFEDDSVFEPWITVQAVRITPPDGVWGLPVAMIHSGRKGDAGRFNPPIKEPEDISRLVEPKHEIDEERTQENAARLHGAIGDILTVNIDRGPAWRMWNADISTQLAYLRGLEQVMWDMTDRPAWLHELLAFMRDGILKAHAEAEAAGHWTLCDHQNQSMPYAHELADPAPNSNAVTRDQLWCFCASQETTLVGPAMFEEFMLQYQIPIMAPFGLVAYGCCEDLTRKIGLLRRIPNLRRIAVALSADVAKCAEQIGTGYVLSYRPSPAEMVGYGFDPGRIRGILRRDFAACRGCHMVITLKDVETVQRDPGRIGNWVRIVREVIEEFA